MKLNPNRFPAENFDLSSWQLQTPIKDGESIRILHYDELKDYDSDIFYTSSDGSMTFKCPTIGYTSKNSKYPRVELRENFEWDLLKGTHLLLAKVKITKVAEGKGVIFAQVHGTDSTLNPQIIKLYFDINGNVYIEHKNDKDPPSKQTKVQIGKYSLGAIINYLILVESGKVSIFINGIKKIIQFSNEYWRKQRFYFKAGNYIQDNAGDNYSMVQIYNLYVSHM